MSYKKNNRLFQVDWNPFGVTLLQRLQIVDDPFKLKKEIKKGLVQIRDIVDDPLILSWSGGFDSAFVVLCYLELIKEQKLTNSCYSISGARFVGENGGVTNIDWDRGINFLKHIGIDSYNVNIDLQDVVINPNFIKQCSKVCVELQFLNMGFAAQEVWRSKQPGCVIFHMGQTSMRGTTGETHSTTNKEQGLCTFIPYQFTDYRDNANSINIFTWNDKIFNCFNSPYVAKAPRVEYDASIHTNEYQAWAIDTHMGRNIIMLSCFPELVLLYPKLPTLNLDLVFDKDEGLKNYCRVKSKIIKRFIGEVPPFVSLKLPNGETIVSIEQTKKYFSGVYDFPF